MVAWVKCFKIGIKNSNQFHPPLFAFVSVHNIWNYSGFMSISEPATWLYGIRCRWICLRCQPCLKISCYRKDNWEGNVECSKHSWQMTDGVRPEISDDFCPLPFVIRHLLPVFCNLPSVVCHPLSVFSLQPSVFNLNTWVVTNSSTYYLMYVPYFIIKIALINDQGLTPFIHKSRGGAFLCHQG